MKRKKCSAAAAARLGYKLVEYTQTNFQLELTCSAITKNIVWEKVPGLRNK